MYYNIICATLYIEFPGQIRKFDTQIRQIYI